MQCPLWPTCCAVCNRPIDTYTWNNNEHHHKYVLSHCAMYHIKAVHGSLCTWFAVYIPMYIFVMINLRYGRTATSTAIAMHKHL